MWFLFLSGLLSVASFLVAFLHAVYGCEGVGKLSGWGLGLGSPHHTVFDPSATPPL